MSVVEIYSVVKYNSRETQTIFPVKRNNDSADIRILQRTVSEHSLKMKIQTHW